MRKMDSYDWAVYRWFTETANTLKNAKKLCKKHFDTEDVDILNVYKVMEMYEKEKNKKKYMIIKSEQTSQRGITCLTCNKTSFNQNDIENLYCGFCHKFHE
jgi:ribosomal protein S27AE